MASPPPPIIWPGRPYPLGATWNGEGVNFALYSEHAEKVELCLFDVLGRREAIRVALPEHTDMVWHGYMQEVRPGQLYGYRAYGPTNVAANSATRISSCSSTLTMRIWNSVCRQSARALAGSRGWILRAKLVCARPIRMMPAQLILYRRAPWWS